MVFDAAFEIAELALSSSRALFTRMATSVTEYSGGSAMARRDEGMVFALKRQRRMKCIVGPLMTEDGKLDRPAPEGSVSNCFSPAAERRPRPAADSSRQGESARGHGHERVRGGAAWLFSCSTTWLHQLAFGEGD